MSAFLGFVEFLVAIAIVLSLVGNYLIINKLWKRRMVREVADSVSIAAALLGLFNAVPFLILFMLVNHSPAGAAKTAISIVTAIVFVLIGSGLWVAELRDRGFRNLFMRALRLERKESADLIRHFAQPRGAEQILRVLHQLASVDGDVDEREASLMRDFAREWRLPEPGIREQGPAADLITLRNSVKEYLKVRPPETQVGQLRDVLQLLAESDARVTWQESVALEEVNGMLSQYLAGAEARFDMHEVLIVPQSGGQVDAVRTLLPGREEKLLRGGRVFSAGRFHSPRYAEFVCQKYIGLGLFSTVVVEAGSDQNAPPSVPVAAPV